MLIDARGGRAFGFLLLLAVGCGGAAEASPTGGSAGAGTGRGGAAGAAAAQGGGGAGGAAITDGSERCTRLRVSGTLAGEPLQGSNGWLSFGTWTDPPPWHGSYAWHSHALELRGPAEGAPVAYVEGAVLTAAYGYMVRADAMPWRASCIAPTSTVRMLNANDVLDLKFSAASACGGRVGTDEIDICIASPVFSSTAPEPPCAHGVTGTLDGRPAPSEPTTDWSGLQGDEATTLLFGSYVVRLPIANWQQGSTDELDFSGALLAVERAGAFDLYCVNAGRTHEYELTLSGISKLATCDAAATAVESAQVCNWDFTRER